MSTKAILLLTVLLLINEHIAPKPKGKRPHSKAAGGSKLKKPKKAAADEEDHSEVEEVVEAVPFATQLKAKVEKVMVFNVGQGNGVIMETENAYWIVDFGSLGEPSFWAKSDDIYSVRDVTYAAQEMLKEKKLDIIVVVSHPDADHYNELDRLLKLDRLKRRVKRWIFNPVYDESALTQLEDREDLEITSKRHDISAAWIKTQDTVNQNIIFLNVPNYHADETNSNSLILLVKIKNGSKMILSGDATKDTWTDLEKQCTNHAEVKSGAKIASQVFPCNLLGDIGYYLAPHHGSETEDSHTLVNNFKPTKGVIFSAPMYSHHNHPTCTAVIGAINQLRPHKGTNQVAKHLIYCENSKDKSASEIDTAFGNPDTTRVFSYSFGIMPEFNNELLIDEAKHDQLGDTFLGAPRYILIETILPIWVTGISGEILCDAAGCRPSPSLMEATEVAKFKVNPENLLKFALLPPVEGNEPFIITKFTQQEISDGYKAALASAPARRSQNQRPSRKSQMINIPEAIGIFERKNRLLLI